MLLPGLGHPDILSVLAKAGPGDYVVLGNGDYPLETQTYKGATKVDLNLRLGQVLVTDVLEAILTVVSVERAFVQYESLDVFKTLLMGKSCQGLDPQVLPLEVPIIRNIAMSENTVLAVASGDQRSSNIVLILDKKYH
ncbi:hypothetical protein BC938DRAFT_471547 [Jimgerdemannia flammicorona]|uniref:Uncharacterized protein n=1 Tax=Jimgerdemannia flammicorona TaxID=994334 RepID=A0A433QUJ0_9FUNG|nr:hypothetical protein BC938DRAFT_471547 [Jimgerdemannia flammicorona]